MDGLSNCPKDITTTNSTPESSNPARNSGVCTEGSFMSGSELAAAKSATGVGWSRRCRPAGRSGCVATPRSSTLVERIRAATTGSAMLPEPRK